MVTLSLLCIVFALVLFFLGIFPMGTRYNLISAGLLACVLAWLLFH